MDTRERTQKLAHDIRTKIYGREVREALATGIEESGNTSQEARDITENLLDGSYDTGLLNTEIEQRMNNLYSTKGQAMDDLYAQKNTELTDLYINEKSELDNLQADYANRAETLETTYAPRLTSVEQDVAQLAQVVTLSSNYPTIQEAINNTDNNGVLHLEHNKVYEINEELLLDKNITINGNNSTLIVNSENGIIGRGELKSTEKISGTYSKGSYEMILEDTTGIQRGDQLNIVSSELFDPTRTYYYKGGNVKVSTINGNRVGLSMPFPFDMDESVVVKVYKPITVKLSNMKIVGSGTLPYNKYGVMVSYGVDCVFENLEIDNFCLNIRYDRLIDTTVKNVNTFRAKNNRSDAWDGYGHAIYSCTNITISQSTTKSGQHGITWSGQEVNFGIVINECEIDNEVHVYGLGQHENIHDVTIKNSTLYGFSVAGHVTMENCDIYPNKGDTNRNNVMLPSDEYGKTTFKFLNCRFNGMTLLTADYFQVDAPSRKYIDSIIVEDCKGLPIIRTNIAYDRDWEKVGEVKRLHVIRTNTSVILYDNLGHLILDGVIAPKEHPTLRSENQLHGHVKEIVMKNTTLSEVYNTILVYSIGKFIFDNVNIENDVASSSMTLSDINELVITNSSLSNFGRGIELENINKLNMSNSDVKFYKKLNGEHGLQAVKNARGVNINDTFKNCEVITTPDESKYIISYNNDGTKSQELVN